MEPSWSDILGDRTGEAERFGDGERLRLRIAAADCDQLYDHRLILDFYEEISISIFLFFASRIENDPYEHQVHVWPIQYEWNRLGMVFRVNVDKRQKRHGNPRILQMRN